MCVCGSGLTALGEDLVALVAGSHLCEATSLQKGHVTSGCACVHVPVCLTLLSHGLCVRGKYSDVGSPGVCMPSCLGCLVGVVWLCSSGCHSCCPPTALPPHQGQNHLRWRGPEMKSCPSGDALGSCHQDSAATDQELSTLVLRTPLPPPATPQGPQHLWPEEASPWECLLPPWFCPGLGEG